MLSCNQFHLCSATISRCSSLYSCSTVSASLPARSSDTALIASTSFCVLLLHSVAFFVTCNLIIRVPIISQRAVLFSKNIIYMAHCFVIHPLLGRVFLFLLIFVTSISGFISFLSHDYTFHSKIWFLGAVSAVQEPTRD